MRLWLVASVLFAPGLLLLSGRPALGQSCSTVYRAPTYSSYSAPTYAPTYAASVYKAPVYAEVVKPVVKEVYVPVAVYAPVAVLVPAYTASYTPPPVAAPASTTAPASAPAATTSPAAAPSSAPGEKTLMDLLNKMDRRLDALERRGYGGDSSVTPPATTPAPAATLPPASTPRTTTPTPAAAPGGITTPASRGGPVVFATKCASCHQQGREGDGGGFVLLDAAGSPVRLEAKGLLAMSKVSYSGRMPPKKSGIAPLTDPEVAEIMAWVDSQPK